MIKSDLPIVTVCLITYNHSRFIREALESILEQRANFVWDIIIADDFSTDGTTEIVKEYAAKYPNKIKLILQPHNVGLQQNFIDLFTAPNSKYIAFLDGDDIWTNSLRLQKQVDFLDQHPDYAMVYGKHLLMDEYGNNRKYKKIPKYKSGYIFKDVILCKYLPPMAAALMVNTEVKKIYSTKKEPGIDFYLIASICKDNKVAYMDDYFFSYRINDASITNSQRPFMNKLFVKNMLLFEKDAPFLVKKGIKNGQLRLLYLYAEKYPSIKTFFSLLKSFKFSVTHFKQLVKCLFNIIELLPKKSI